MNTNGDPYRGPHIFLSIPEGELVTRLISPTILNADDALLRDSVLQKVRAARSAHPAFHQPHTELKPQPAPLT